MDAREFRGLDYQTVSRMARDEAARMAEGQVFDAIHCDDRYDVDQSWEDFVAEYQRQVQEFPLLGGYTGSTVVTTFQSSDVWSTCADFGAPVTGFAAAAVFAFASTAAYSAEEKMACDDATVNTLLYVRMVW